MRGPNTASPGILKPDIIDPGVNVLAAWPFQVGSSASSDYVPSFNVMTGGTGIAALIKSAHPNWSPAMIKSAIMTTADLKGVRGESIVDEQLNSVDVFAMGAGHVNPTAANDPGLLYDLQPQDCIPYLCVQTITRRPVACRNVTSIHEGELNYPSFSVNLGSSQTFHRTLTNVGKPSASVQAGTVNEKKNFSVTFNRTSSAGASGYSEADLKWMSYKHSLRSPISYNG
ncbi:hypothetical protein ACLOJK_006097 [Asimina triloba]